MLDVLPPWKFLFLAIALLAGIVVVYYPTLDYQFILDDHRFVSDPRVQSSGHVGEYFSNYVWAQFVGGPPSFYRPLFILWLRANYILNEMSPWAWHLLSVLKHVGAASLLALLAWTLLRDRWAALIAAGLFALHPAQTESVAWVTVPDPLMSIAVLLALILCAKYLLVDTSPSEIIADRRSRKRKRPAAISGPSAWWLLGSAVAWLSAEFAKETAVALGVIFFALFLVTAPALKSEASGSGSVNTAIKTRVSHALRLSIPYLCATLLYIGLRFSALKGKIAPQTQHLPSRTVLLSCPATLWFYVKVMFWPFRLHAFADSSEVERFSVHGVLLPALAICCAIAALIGLSLWVWRKTQHDPSYSHSIGIRCTLVIGTSLLLLPILPALNLNALNPGDSLHGRYTYLPLAGLALIVATAWHLLSRWRIHLLALAGLLMITLAGLTFQQEPAWKDDLAVFTLGHEIAPNNGPVALNLARVHVHEGLKLGEAGRCEEALPIFQRVIQQYPQDWFAWAGLGNCFGQLRDLPKAEQALHRAADLSHSPQVVEQWELVRTMMRDTNSAPPE